MYTEQTFTHQLPPYDYSKPANMAPGSVKAITGLVGRATGGAVVGTRGAVGMLTNCSLMNSFSLQVKRSERYRNDAYQRSTAKNIMNTYSNVSVGSPEATVIRNCVLSAGSVSILI